MTKPGPERDEITVILPPEPPELNPKRRASYWGSCSRPMRSSSATSTRRPRRT